MTATFRSFSQEDAQAFLPKVTYYDPFCASEQSIPLDPYFPKTGAYLSEEQLHYTLGFLWPMKYCEERVVVAQRSPVTYATAGFFATGDRDPDHLGAGHVLFEGNPGTGKTLLGNIPKRLFNARFGRLQAMADSTPSDYTGTRYIVYSENPIGPELENELAVLAEDDKQMAKILRVIALAMHQANPRQRFEYVEGPGHAPIQLIDEINRMPERTTSGVLEQMSEGKITQFNKTYSVNGWIIATMNPRESRGVVPLGRALLDRFMFSVLSERFKEGDRAEILRRTQHMQEFEFPMLGTMDDVRAARKFFHEHISVSDNIRLLIDQTLLRAQAPWEFPGVMKRLAENPRTRRLPTEVFVGVDRTDFILAAVEGRGTTHFEGAAKLMAVYNYRPYVTRDDVCKVMPYVCAHRIEFTPSVLYRFMQVEELRLPEVAKRKLARAILDASYVDAAVTLFAGEGR